jgi:hypothetical protein
MALLPRMYISFLRFQAPRVDKPRFRPAIADYGRSLIVPAKSIESEALVLYYTLGENHLSGNERSASPASNYVRRVLQ